jgi:hypothetical protein
MTESKFTNKVKATAAGFILAASSATMANAEPSAGAKPQVPAMTAGIDAAVAAINKMDCSVLVPEIQAKKLPQQPLSSAFGESESDALAKCEKMKKDAIAHIKTPFQPK